MDFFIIANAWSAGKDNPTSKHRIALELVRKGHRVLWIEGSGMRAPSVGSSSDRLRMLRKVAAAFRGARKEIPASPEPRTLTPPALWVLSPLFIPLPRYELVRRLNGLICRCSMRFWAWRLGFRDPVLINYVPVLAEAMRGWRRASRVVYHCVDRWDAFAMYDSAMMSEMDRRCCAYADLVIGSSRDLVERCRRYNDNVHLVSHGVDWEHFRHAVDGIQVFNNPTTFPSKPVIGFFGLLSEWVDQELLLKLARECPGATIELIGKADVDVSRLKGVSNIHLMGPKPFSDLPSHIARFTVGIIPFVINELTTAVNPIKLREMLSAGCPVVSTALPEVKGYRGEGVDVAESADRFVEAVMRRINHPATSMERTAISDGVASETWEAKVAEILSLIGEDAPG